MSRKEFLECDKIGDSVNITSYTLSLIEEDKEEVQEMSASFSLEDIKKANDFEQSMVIPALHALQHEFSQKKAKGYKSVAPLMVQASKNVRFFEEHGLKWMYSEVEGINGNGPTGRFDILMIKDETARTVPTSTYTQTFMVDMRCYLEQLSEPVLLQLEAAFMNAINTGYKSVKPTLPQGQELIKEEKRGDMFYLISKGFDINEQVYVHTKMEYDI
jgi:hypothetical protein